MLTNIHSTIFNSYAEAIAAVGKEIVRVPLLSPPELRVHPCSVEMDCVSLQPQPLVRTEIIFRLRQFWTKDSRGETTFFWRYCREA